MDLDEFISQLLSMKQLLKMHDLQKVKVLINNCPVQRVDLKSDGEATQNVNVVIS